MNRRLMLAAVLALVAGMAGASGAQAAVTTVAPVADASVTAAGGAPVLRGRAYVRFRVPALDGAVTTARLRLRSRAARRAGIDVLVLPASARWSERRLRARNAPRGGRLVGRVKRVRRGTFSVALDVSRLGLAQGKRLDLAIAPRRCSRSRCPRPLALASREAGRRGPRLELTATPAPAPPPPAPDTTAPAVALSRPAAGGATDGLPTFAGSTEPGAQVTVRVARTAGSAPVSTFAAGVAGDGAWSARAPGLLSPGDYLVSASARDPAGNEAATMDVPFSVIPTVATAGDIACDPASNLSDAYHCQQRATSELLLDRGYHRVLTLGDTQYDNGTLDAFNAVFHPTWGRVKDLIRPVAGNHEYQDPAGGAKGYFDYFNGAGQATGPAGQRGAGWYEFTLGQWHLIALNSDCADVVGGCGAGSAQETWLKAALAGSSAKCTLVYWHHPRFSSGNGHDDPGMQQIWQDLVDAKADLVLNGHSHGYEQFDAMDGTGASDPAGVQEIVVGTGGENFFPLDGVTAGTSKVKIANTFGVLRLSLRPAGYDWQFISTAGATLTQGTRTCH